MFLRIHCILVSRLHMLFLANGQLTKSVCLPATCLQRLRLDSNCSENPQTDERQQPTTDSQPPESLSTINLVGDIENKYPTDRHHPKQVEQTHNMHESTQKVLVAAEGRIFVGAAASGACGALTDLNSKQTVKRGREEAKESPIAMQKRNLYPNAVKTKV